MKRISHFRFSRSQRSGIFFLGSCIVVVQVLLWQGVFEPDTGTFTEKDPYVEQVNAYMDSLESIPQSAYEPRPFNPNYMSDQKGYRFGMSPEAIDRLFRFREAGGFVNTAEEFQEVTRVHDTVLGVMAPYFEFPRFPNAGRKTLRSVVKRDINTVEGADLQEVYGIGPVLAARIVAYRERLGGFALKEQLEEVYGLPPGVLPELWRRFHLDQPAVYPKRDINVAGLEELSELPYVSRSLAAKIIAYRSSNQRIDSLSELTKFHNLSEKDLSRIGLYLEVE